MLFIIAFRVIWLLFVIGVAYILITNQLAFFKGNRFSGVVML